MRNILIIMLVWGIVFNSTATLAIQLDSDIAPTIKEIDLEVEKRKYEQEAFSNYSRERRARVAQTEKAIKETTEQINTLLKVAASRGVNAISEKEHNAAIMQVNIGALSVAALGVGATFLIAAKKTKHRLMALVPVIVSLFGIDHLLSYESEVERMTTEQILRELKKKEKELEGYLYILKGLKD